MSVDGNDEVLSKPASAWKPASGLGRTVFDAVRRGERCRIVFLGDSLTSTEWVHPNWRDAVEYAIKQCSMTAVDDWRRSSWGIRCFNAGFDGATTRDWLERIDEDVLALDPDIAIVLGTRNDWEFAIPAAESTRNIEQLLIRLQTARVPHIAYATSFADANRERLTRSREYFASIRDVASRLGVTTLDLLTAMTGSDHERFYTFEIDEDNVVTGERRGDRDTSHPNALGNCEVAAIILRELFDIPFDAGAYLADTHAGIKYPRFSRSAATR